MSVPFARRQLALDMVQKFLHPISNRQNYDERKPSGRNQFLAEFIVLEVQSGPCPELYST
jgi:hypothetical protein